jgi:hypothetical protein
MTNQNVNAAFSTPGENEDWLGTVAARAEDRLLHRDRSHLSPAARLLVVGLKKSTPSEPEQVEVEERISLRLISNDQPSLSAVGFHVPMLAVIEDE